MSAIDGTGNDLGYLTYFSSAVERFNQSGLKRLLEISRRNNEPRGITGLCWYRDGHFLQYLEGRKMLFPRPTHTSRWTDATIRRA